MLENHIRAIRLVGLSLLLLCFISEGHAGSPCLPREDIYPCTCTSVPLTKKTSFTVVTCSHIVSSTLLSTAFINFRRMDIDRFIIIDSFLQAKKLYGTEADKHQTLPQDWLSRLKIRELEIVDSEVSSCFMCESSAKCRNTYQTHISLVNSSTSESICTICKAANNARFSWTGCMERLKHFSFSGNHLSAVEKDLFPENMKELQVLTLNNNKIAKVGKDAFKNLPKLTTLDLSHNEIRDIAGDIFGENSNPHLNLLDLSWNQIVTVPGNLLTLSPALRTLNLHNNLLKKLDKEAWKGLSQEIRTINLEENPICCDCELTWFNASLKVHAAVLGNCAEPERFQDSNLRQASRLLYVACNDPSKKDAVEKCPA